MTDSAVSPASTTLNSKKIKFLLKYEPSKYKIIKNESSSPSINW